MKKGASSGFSQLFKMFEPRKPRVQAILTDVINGGTGNAAVAGRPGYVWALVGGAIMQVRAPDIMPVANLPIEITKSNADGLYESTGVNYAAIDGWDGSSFWRQHGDQHNIDGGDPVFIDQRQLLIGLLREQDTPDMTVIAGPVYYTYLNSTVRFEQVDTADLTSYLPANAGFSKWVNVSINLDTQALVYTGGTEFTAAYDDPEDFFPSLPTGVLTLGDIRLEFTSTTITQDMIDGRRRSFLNASGISNSLTSRVLTTGSTLVIPDTYNLIVSGYYTLQGTAAVVLEGDAELRII